jgi:hypothetical protein
MDAEVSTHAFLTMIIEESVCFISCEPIFFCNRSKADFKSKSQNIWQQIILLSRTVMQRICAWPKIWTLSGRLWSKNSIIGKTARYDRIINELCYFYKVSLIKTRLMFHKYHLLNQLQVFMRYKKLPKWALISL